MKTWLSYGVGFGLATCGWALLEHVLGFHTTRMELGQISSYCALVLPLTFVVLAGLAERRRVPAASVGRFMGVALLVLLVGDCISTPFLWAYHHYILPDWMDRLLAFQREKLLLEGMPPAEINQRLAAMAMGSSNTALVLGGLFGAIVLGLLIGTPMGFILRRRPETQGSASSTIRHGALG